MNVYIALCTAVILTCGLIRRTGSQDITFNSPLVYKGKLAFASYYGDHMVLQQSPKRSTVWGVGSSGDTLTVTLIGHGVKKVYKTTVKLGYYPTVKTQAGVWSVMLDAIPAGGPYSIIVEDDDGFEAIFLNDIMFGDVWVCSGQSNMQFTMSQIMNSSAEIKSANNYPDIRIFMAELRYDTVLRTDLIAVREEWSLSSQKSVPGFSALCWLYGRHLYETMGYPVGLIASVWGGTRVEAWSAPEVLKSCGVPTQETLLWKQQAFGTNQNSNSVLWNAMIHPLLNMTIYGAIWYQGEQNAAIGSTNYNCTFPGMITDWRRKFHEGTNGQTDLQFPFGFVQLDGDFKPPEGDIPTGFPDIRWQQTASVGYVPNSKMKNVFMAVAMDLPDYSSPYWPVHSRFKQDVASRLWTSSLAIAYGRSVRFQGPFPTSFTLSKEAVEVKYDKGRANLDIRKKDGFEFCCTGKAYEYCASDDKRWMSSRIINSSESTITLNLPIACKSNTCSGIRYAWRESPCSFKMCAVYAKESQLPAPPFVNLFASSNEDAVSSTLK